MKDEDRQPLKRHIKDAIQAVNREIEALEITVRPVAPDNAIGRLSRMEAIGNKTINEQVYHHALERRQALHHMLERIDSPQYGLCHECSEPIPIARLLAMPESRLCVACATEASQ